MMAVPLGLGQGWGGVSLRALRARTQLHRGKAEAAGCNVPIRPYLKNDSQWRNTVVASALWLPGTAVHPMA